MGVREVFEVLYSPVDAFKKIVEKPDFKGVLLILVLVIFSMLVMEYVATSKFFLETRSPEDENWTESTKLWSSNGSLSLDEADYKVGNRSVQSFVSNGISISMNITEIDPVDCSGDTGYGELFFWIKWIHENEMFPSSNATLRLFSENESSFFELNMTDFISISSGEWSNATVLLGPESQGWDSTYSDWKNITGLEFRLAWLTSANLTLKVDDLYFRKYVSPIETSAFSGSIIFILMSAALEFSMNWILWALILVLIVKVFREEGGPWTVFFVIIGHAFSVTVVYALASAMLLSSLPALNLPLKVDDVNVLIHEMWYPNWAYQVLYFLPFVREVWTAVLCVIAIHLLLSITWKKAASISMVAFVIRFVLRLFFGF